MNSMNSLNSRTSEGGDGARSAGLKKWGEAAVGHDLGGAEAEIRTVLSKGARGSGAS
jgi:hypothetical protein